MMIVAAVVSAANPWTGSSSTTRWPIVLMIRQPPTAVPSEIAVAARTMTQSGTSIVGMTPAENSARVMMPIVFWASFEPWLNAMNAGRHDLEAPESIVPSGLRLALPEDVQYSDHHQREADRERR